MTVIELKNVSYNYSEKDVFDSKNALTNINLTFKQGEFVALCGHNGSGKSTLAKLLNGLYLPTEGDITAFTCNTKDKSKVFEIRKNVGMVFQNPDNQMIATIVEDDIAFGPENLGVPPKEIRERVDYALSAVGMEGFAKRTPFKLSGGQKQRIAIAGILAIKPRVLVLDESTAMLDPKGRREVLEVVKGLQKNENMTIILITHFMDEAAIADRVVVLDKGMVVLDGVPAEVFAKQDVIKAAGLKLPRALKLAEYLNEDGVNIGSPLDFNSLLGKIKEIKFVK